MIFVITKNLHFCLMNIIDNWYTNKLNNDFHRIYKIDFIQQWCIVLKKWFKKSTDQALIKFHQIQYTIADVRKWWDSSEFIQDIIILKSNSYTLILFNAQTMYAFKRIKNKFQIIMNFFINSLIIMEIFRNMNFHKHDWFDVYFFLRFFLFKTFLFSFLDEYFASSNHFNQNGFFTKNNFIDYSGSSFNKSFGRNSETKTEKDSNQKRFIDIFKYGDKSNQFASNEKHNDRFSTSSVSVKVESSSNFNADQSNSMTRFQFNHEYSNHNRRNNNRWQNNNQKRFWTYHDEHSNDDFFNQSSDRSNGRLMIDYFEMKEADEKRIQKINNNNVEIHFFNKITTIKTIIIKIFCNQCNEKFDLNNKLHQHIKLKTCRKSCHSLISAIIFFTFNDTTLSTIINSAFSNIDESIAPFSAKLFADIETNFKNFNPIDTNIHHVLFVKSFFKKIQFVVLFVISFFQFKEYGCQDPEGYPSVP